MPVSSSEIIAGLADFNLYLRKHKELYFIESYCSIIISVSPEQLMYLDVFINQPLGGEMDTPFLINPSLILQRISIPSSALTSIIHIPLRRPQLKSWQRTGLL